VAQNLVMLPLQAASFGMRLAMRAASLPVEIARSLLQGANPEGPPVTPEPDRNGGDPVVHKPRPHPGPPEVVMAAPAAAPEPGHVDEGVQLVAEVAEPGAEQGAGPEISVAEPWEGYARMRADVIVGRLRDATATEAAAVELYEATHKARQSVLRAAERRLRDGAR
jgi:hypothetical protein